MAVGVPEIEVFAAADPVLARGERRTANGRQSNGCAWSWGVAARRGLGVCSINSGRAFPNA